MATAGRNDEEEAPLSFSLSLSKPYKNPLPTNKPTKQPTQGFSFFFLSGEKRRGLPIKERKREALNASKIKPAAFSSLF